MRSLKEKRVVFDPIRSIEWVIAIMTIAGGAFVFTPLYTVQTSQVGPSAVATALGHPAMIALFGALLLIGAFLVILGMVTELPHIRSGGWFVILMVRFFQVLTVWLTAGFYPISWIYPFTLALICLVLWAYARGQVMRNNARS